MRDMIIATRGMPTQHKAVDNLTNTQRTLPQSTHKIVKKVYPKFSNLSTTMKHNREVTYPHLKLAWFNKYASKV